MSEHGQPRISPIDPDQAEGRVRELFQAAEGSLGFVPNIYRLMAAAPGLLETYRLGYGTIRSGSLTPSEQECVFLTASPTAATTA